MRRIWAILFSVVLVFSVNVGKRVGAIDCDWRMLGGGPTHVGVAMKECGPSSGGLKREWEFRKNGKGICFGISIAVQKDSLFIQYANDDKKTTHILCIDTKTGKEKWNYTGELIGITTPAIDGDKLYCGEINGLLCIDSNKGTKIWQYTIEGSSYAEAIAIGVMQPMPTIWGDYVYFGTGNKTAYCINKKLGTLKWQLLTDGLIGTSPAISNGNAFIVSEKTMYCVDAISGVKKWQKTFDGRITTSPSIANGNIYFSKIIGDPGVGNGDELPPMPSKFTCINEKDGNIIWEYKIEDRSVSVPVISNDVVYFACINGTVLCLNAKTGKDAWTFETPEPISFSIAACGEYVFTGSFDNSLYVIDKNTGLETYSFQTDGPIRTQPAIADGKIFFATEDFTLYCLSDDPSAKKPLIIKSVKVLPETRRVNLGAESKFIAKVTGNNNKDIQNLKINWSVEPPEYGTITPEGLFKSLHPGVCKVRASINEYWGEAEVIIVGKVDPEIEANLDFEELVEGQEKTLKIKIKNPSEFPMKITLKTLEDWLKLGKTEIEIPPNSSIEVDVTAITGFLPSDKKIEGLVTIDWLWNRKTLTAYIIKIPVKPLELSQTEFTFKDVKPGSDLEIVFTVKNPNPIPIQVNFSSTHDWVVLENPIVTFDPFQELEIKSMIDCKEFKYNQTYNATLTLDWVTAKANVQVIAEMLVDKTAPDLKIDPIIDSRDQKEVTVTGTVEPGAIVIVTGDLIKEPIYVDVKDNRFTFTTSVISPPSKTNITITAMDEAENKTATTLTIQNLHVKVVKLIVDVPKMYVDGVESDIDPPPKIIKGSTMVPLRAVSTAFGIEPSYNAYTKTATIIYSIPQKIINIQITLGSKDAMVNDKIIKLSQPALIVNGRMMVPFRFIAEALGASVSFDKEIKLITMSLDIYPQ